MPENITLTGDQVANLRGMADAAEILIDEYDVDKLDEDSINFGAANAIVDLLAMVLNGAEPTALLRFVMDGPEDEQEGVPHQYDTLTVATDGDGHTYTRI